MSAVEVGQAAPDFTLRDQYGAEVALSSFRGSKAVAVMFFPAAFSGVCSGEMGQIEARLDELVSFDTEVVAVLPDGMFALRALSDQEGLTFPLLSDFWPHGGVASAYGVFDGETGMAKRSSFVVDPDGVVTWAVHNAGGEARNLDEHIRQLRLALPGA